MPQAKDVKLLNGNSIKKYSLIMGGNPLLVAYMKFRCLGEALERWNDEIGFPSTRGHAQWHVVPEFLWISVLQGSLLEIERKHTKTVKNTKKKSSHFFPNLVGRLIYF